MRKLSEVTAQILYPSQARSFGRRPIDTRHSGLTALVLFKHDETETQLFVSDDGDAVGAVWIKKSPVLVEAKDRGRFLVVTMLEIEARQKGLSPYSILNWESFTQDERAQLKDAILSAKRTRDRLSGRCTPGLHPNATA